MYRQFSQRVGGNPQCSPYGPRFLGPGNLGKLQHQLARAQDSAPWPGALSRPSQEQVSDDQVGQSGDCLQPDQTGGDTLPGSLLSGMGDPPLLQRPPHHDQSTTSDGGTQCDRRPAQPSIQGDSHGVDLNKSVFTAVVNELGEPGLDLFATCLNNRLPVYVSPRPDPQALALDALILDWNTLPLAYAFAPMPILPKVLQKIQDSTVTVILIAPAWPTQSWFPDLLNLLIRRPVEIPVLEDLLTQQVGRQVWTHHNLAMYNYHAWMLSGIPSLREDFLRQQPRESPSLREVQPEQCMMESGQSSVIGVVDRRKILSVPLSL